MKTICATTANGLCTIKVCEINKLDAEGILNNNTRNRKILESNVEILRRSMDDGKWMFNGDTIVIDCEGYLKSGQHRLTAFVRSNIETLTCIIVYLSNSDDVLLTLNRGKSMSCAQYLSIVGIERSSANAALARYSIILLKGLPVNSRVPDYEIESFIRKNPCLIDFVRAAAGHFKNGEKNIPTPIVAPLLAISVEFPELKDGMMTEIVHAKQQHAQEGHLSDIIIREAMRSNRGGTGALGNINNVLSQMYRFFNDEKIIRKHCAEKTYEDVVDAAIKNNKVSLMSRRNPF